MTRSARAAKFVVRACIVASLLPGFLVLAGCGQTGPLYLPDRETKTVEPPVRKPGTESTTEEPTKKKEEPR